MPITNIVSWRRQCLKGAVLLAAVGMTEQAANGEANQSSALYVGILETIEGVESGIPMERTSFSQVRYAFVLKDGKWSPVPNTYPGPPALPEAMTWVAIDAGRAVGALQTSGSAVPAAGPHAYAQSLEAPFQVVSNGGAPVYRYHGYATTVRPLLAASRKEAAADPQGWTRTALSAAESRRLISEMRKLAPRLPICDANAGFQRRIDYADADVQILDAYRDVGNRLLVGMQFDSKAQGRSLCGAFDYHEFPELLDVWLLLRQDGTASVLGSRMFPVGAADLDQDGSSDWVFKTSGHVDGYRLFHRGLSEKVDAYWASG